MIPMSDAIVYCVGAFALGLIYVIVMNAILSWHDRRMHRRAVWAIRRDRILRERAGRSL